ncbi:MAG: hypothetical protein QG597_352 [Actinomycetota bacterium]|nr:hypothetical protein [Actinomycetota bacterium]
MIMANSVDPRQNEAQTHDAEAGDVLPVAAAEAFFGGDDLGLAALSWVQTQLTACGGAELRVTRTQVGWARRRGFATLWSPRRATGHGAPWALTIHLSQRLDSPRFKQVVEVRPDLWAHHLELWDAASLNDDVAAWLHRACDDASHVTVLDPGPAAILVDEGRRGWAHLAVTSSGAFDRPAHRLANRLVGNNPGAATIEYLLGPLSLLFHTRTTIAVTGVDADVTLTSPQGRRTTHTTHSTIAAGRGSTVTIGTATSGLRGYLAVRGGWDVAPVLGSRSRDTLAGLGPEPLRPGTGLPIGTASGPFPATDHAPRPAPPRHLVLHLLHAPRANALLLPRSALAHLEWAISHESNRIGVRLRGPRLPVTAQAASEPLVRGAVQVPPDGQPVIMGPDHPTTGGYPVIGVVAEADTDALAQARPGTTVRLRPMGSA